MSIFNVFRQPIRSVGVITNPVTVKLTDETTDANKILTVPTAPSELRQVLGITVKYVSSATAGNRDFELEIRDESDNVIWCDFPGGDFTQAASNTYYYMFWPGVTTDTAIVAGSVNFVQRALPPTLILPESFDIFARSKTVIDANADTVSIWCYCDQKQVDAMIR